VADLRDFVLGEFGSAEQASEEVRTGDYESQEEAIAEARAEWDAFVEGSPPPVQEIGGIVNGFLDDWEAVWIDACCRTATSMSTP
jgi:hypothetical protein